MEILIFLILTFLIQFVIGYANRFGQDYYEQRKRTTSSPSKSRSSSKIKK